MGGVVLLLIWKTALSFCFVYKCFNNVNRVVLLRIEI